MMISQQLLLWPETEAERNAREIAELKATVSKVRKGTYSEIGELRKNYKTLIHEFEQLKSAMCKGEKIHVDQQPLF